MKKVLAVGVPLALLFGLNFGYAQESEAATKVVTFKNCTEMNKVYKGGVARAANINNKGGKTKYKPFVSKALYDANTKSDRDKDLIACEQ